MKRRPQSLPEEDSAVAAIEHILSTAAPARTEPVGLTGDRVAAANALWICACVSNDDAPTWLVYETLDGAIVWHRVPGGVEPLALVDARRSAGGHAEPVEVLRWLHGTALDPWSGFGYGTDDGHVTDDLRQKICDLA